MKVLDFGDDKTPQLGKEYSLVLDGDFADVSSEELAALVQSLLLTGDRAFSVVDDTTGNFVPLVPVVGVAESTDTRALVMYQFHRCDRLLQENRWVSWLKSKALVDYFSTGEVERYCRRVTAQATSDDSILAQIGNLFI